MTLALEQAKIAYALGEIPVGAIIVRDGIVIASAHNRRELDKNPTAHAEILAIQQAASVIGDWRLDGCQIFVTLEPCAMCAGALWASRITHCVYAASDPRSGFLGSVHDITQHTVLNHHYTVQKGIQEQESVALLQSFFRGIREKKKREKKDTHTK